MKKIRIIVAVLALALVSCNDETSLQEYYVQNQQNNQFLALDIPASLLTAEAVGLNAEQQATLETVKKVNLLAFPMNEKNKVSFEEEKEKIQAVLQDEKYHILIKYGGGTRKAELYYIGEDDAIDELIVFGSDAEKGFGIARILGDDMEPEAFIKLLKSLNAGDLNMESLQNLTTFKN